MKSDREIQRVSKGALIAMSAIVVTLLLVTIYANWQNASREKVQSVTVTHFTPLPSPSPSITGP
jgi:uncharacterized membrane protein (DUF485 family)